MTSGWDRPLPDQSATRTAGEFSLRLGPLEISDGLATLRIDDPGPDGGNLVTATVVLDTEVLSRPGINLASRIQIFPKSHELVEPLFTGIVNILTCQGAQSTLNCVTQLHILDEQRMGGLSFDQNANMIELAWSFTRASGIADDRLNIEGFELPDPEVFQIISPLLGIDLVENVAVNGVTLSPKSHLIIQSIDGLEENELTQRFAEAEGWAIAFTSARSLFEAERKGLQLIEAALALFRARLLASSPVFPSGDPREYVRTDTNAKISLADVVTVKGITTRRRWLRAPQDTTPSTQIDSRMASKCQDAGLFSSVLPPLITQALLAWNSSVLATDPIRSVVCLWEAVEFYAAEVKLPKLFTKSQRAKRISMLTGKIEEAQAQRVSALMHLVNQYPLRTRLVAAFKEDHFQYTDEELDHLWKVRALRNQYGHGSAIEVPMDEDLKVAISFVNRFLLNRVHRLQSGHYPEI